MMNIMYTEIGALPPLAWYADISGGTVRVLHGPAVEHNDTCFFEGAWSGDSQNTGFMEADWFCGTGAHVNKDRIVFSTPTHVIYGLYSLKKTNGYCVSNSLYFLMAIEGLRYDINYIRYEVDFNTVIDGINRYKKGIRVLNQDDRVDEIQIEYFKEVTITENGKYISVNKPSLKPFESFDDYSARLHRDIDRMLRNAADSARIHPYGSVTTISKGYDAPCCAAVAKKFGCDTAITFKAEGKYADDCGTEVAKHLGYGNIVEVDANSYKHRTDMVEVEYLCTGELGALISFSSFDPWVRRNVLFTGERGDSVWSKNTTNSNNEFAFYDMLSHLSAAERRLWLDYISVPMPLYGASQWESIFDISNAEEMNEWSMGNGYDRPIPRRIIEEAGVPREMFGTVKHGAGFVYKFDWLKRICARMSVPAAASFKQYVSAHKKLRPLKTLAFFWKLRGVYLNSLGIRVKPLNKREIAGISNPMAASLLIPWAGEIMIGKYQKILEGQSDT